MFKRILVAYDESPDPRRALRIGIDLAKSQEPEHRTEGSVGTRESPSVFWLH
jgi:Universal stress protein family